jgi:DHA2 family methylenomycin A resistance protein-like MFS transporter
LLPTCGGAGKGGFGAGGLSPFATGLVFLPMMGAVLSMNLLAARAAERFGAPVTIAAGAAIAGVGCVALIGIRHGTSYWVICAQLAAIGAGLGLLVPPLTSTLLGSVDKARSGIAAGVLNATRQTGSVLGVALFGSLIGQTNAFIAGTREALIISAILFLGAAVTTLIFALGHRDQTVRKPPIRALSSSV